MTLKANYYFELKSKPTKVQLVPLQEDHLKAFYYAITSDICSLVHMPDLKSFRLVKQWYHEQAKHMHAFAVLHPNAGFVGNFNLRVYRDVAIVFYWIAPAFQQQGFGHQALQQTIIHAFKELSVEGLLTQVWEKNLASIKLLEQHCFERIPIPDRNIDLYKLGLADRTNEEMIAYFPQLNNHPTPICKPSKTKTYGGNSATS